MRHLLVSASILALLSACAPRDGEVGEAASASEQAPSVLAPFGAPGFPEGIAVDGDRVFVAGPAQFDATGAAVRVFDRETGALLDDIPVPHDGGDPADALTCLALDARGRVYVLSEALGVVRLTKHDHGWRQEVYAPLPADGLPGCTHGYQLAPDFADPWMRPACHLLNDLAFDAQGRLYVTDSMRATIYRVEPGGGALTPWFESPYLLGGPPFPMGVNGARVSPAGDALYVTVTTSPLPELAGRGALYRLPLVDAPTPADLTPVHLFDPGLGPDGLAFGEDGRIYTALAFSNQISVLAPDGAELQRLVGPAGSAVPYDAPANLAFDGEGSMLVVNHALLSGIAADMVVLSVPVGDDGARLFRPRGR